MKVIFSTTARADLREIALYIARDSPKRARSFVAELRIKSQEIAHNPHAFPLVPRYEASGIRGKPFQNYLIFYRVRLDNILIVSIMHSARDYEEILFP